MPSSMSIDELDRSSGADTIIKQITRVKDRLAIILNTIKEKSLEVRDVSNRRTYYES